MLWLVLLLLTIGSIFYYTEWKYSLPTPVPEDYKAIEVGEKIVINGLAYDQAKPLFLHFYNPDCPCSRFNMAHFKSLVKEYSDKMQFAIVPMTDQAYSQADIQNKLGLSLPVLFDSTIAEACGVYSTPQAVIINKDQELFYRGNYNRTRYCTDKKTAYAKMAIESILNQKVPITFDAYALKAYGCELPTCTK